MALIVGLTGGIVSGKSTVAKMFKSLGAKIIDADKLGHSIILPHRPAWEKIIRLFGKDILRNDLTIDREKLSKIVFTNQTLLKKLNEIEQVKRLAKRNNLSKEEALQRIKSQMPMKEKVKIADYVIDNSNSLDTTREQVEKIWQSLVSSIS